MADSASHLEAECTAARTDAVVFDLSHRPQIELTGADAVTFLHNLSTNDIKSLSPGRCCEIFLTDNKARIVAHGFAHRLRPAEPATLWLDLDPGSAAKTVAHLSRFLISEQVDIADRSGALAQLHVCGSRAEAILGDKVSGAFPIDRLALPGFDLISPFADAVDLGKDLVKRGATLAGADAFDTLRIEAGVPVDGIDIGPDRFVAEVGRTNQAICYTKGCYLGQEPIVMARDRGHVNRTLLGLKVEGAEPLAVGAKVTQNGQEIGQVTSSVWSPLVGSVIALAYLKRGSQEPGTAVVIAERRGVVAGVPFQG